MKIPWLDSEYPDFPPSEQALESPSGLLAAGGKLTPDWIRAAYTRGIFPWFSEGEPILWWSPAPRMVLYPDQLHIGRTLKKQLRRSPFTEVTIDQCFPEIIRCCAEPRDYDAGTWITEEMISCYCDCHQQGFAHSVEVWSGNGLAGGLYGICLGNVFFGESMFSLEPNASKYALLTLIMQHPWLKLIDCQMKTDYLSSMGGTEISRTVFESFLSPAAPARDLSTDEPVTAEQLYRWSSQ